MSNSALASITAQYTDSENEEEFGKSNESSNSASSQVIIPPPKISIKIRKDPSDNNEYPRTTKLKKAKRKLKRLVSYHDDTIITDDEELSDKSGDDEYDDTDSDSKHSSDDSNSENYKNGETKKSANSHGDGKSNAIEDDQMDVEMKDVADTNSNATDSKSDKYAKYAHYGFSLPPETRGKPLPELTEKIEHLYEKMRNQNMDMNIIIQKRKEFRNPSIYEKLIQFCDINELGTNYPPEIYDPLRWGPESYYEELDRVQVKEMEKRRKERKDKDKIEQVSALARKVEEEAKKRKSKWDQPASSKHSVPAPLTTTVTGTKGTVISAFGSLPKKTSI